MIDVLDIVKRYGATVAVNHVSFRVNHGEILGFLGPNGAGKSTTLKILTCYIVADSGRVSVDGSDVLEDSLGVRQKVGYLPESTPLYSEMRVIDYLRFAGKARQLRGGHLREAIDRIVAMVEIERMLKKNVGHLSKGYRQRVGLAQALIHDPPILILDEPTSGLDPHQIIEIRELLRKLGKTKVILFSSHILQEISAICTRIIIIKDGRLVADGTPESLQAQVAGRQVHRARIHGPEPAVKGRLLSIEGVEGVDVLRQAGECGDYLIRGKSGADLGLSISRAASDSGWGLAQLGPEARSLEEVYLQLTASRAPPVAAAG
ncbi:MAG TPA: ATP-binding cassette domain-containing protein [Planctomycetota bacterium]|nr:ATP-binding cassette domain-containing protein [Planctomycetota bacterium]